MSAGVVKKNDRPSAAAVAAQLLESFDLLVEMECNSMHRETGNLDTIERLIAAVLGEQPVTPGERADLSAYRAQLPALRSLLTKARIYVASCEAFADRFRPDVALAAESCARRKDK